MTKKKIISVLLIAVVLCSVCLLVSGCSDKNKKYDVSMKIVCRKVVDGKATGAVLGEWIFTPDVDVMRIEREYDGREYYYYLSGYALEDFTDRRPTGSTCAEVYSALFIEGEAKEKIRKFVCEKGEYTLLVYAFPSTEDDVLNRRLLRLYISVK